MEPKFYPIEEEKKELTPLLLADLLERPELNRPILNFPYLRGGTINIGSENKVFKFEQDKGIWLGHQQFDLAPFKVDMTGKVTATGVNIQGQLIAGAGSSIDWSYIKNVRVQNAQIVSLDAGKITTGTLTGRTVQTAESGRRVVMETEGDGANSIIFYGSDDYPKLSIYENIIAWKTNPWIISTFTDLLEIRFPIPISDIRSLFFTRGTRADVKIYGSPGTAIEVTSLIPSGANNLGSSTYRWQNLYLSGNIYVNGTVDGVDISAHAANPSAHHTKTAYSSEITVNSNWQMNNYEINNLSYLRFSSSYGQIYWGADLVLDIYPDRIQWGKHLVPKDLASNLNLGSASLYWNEINYKYLTDRGCLGVFDKGVELNDGRIVSDTEALQAIKKRKKKTAYGVPMMDYKTLPKAVYRPAKTKEEAEGAEIGALISIMIGAIRELDKRLKKLENQKK